MLRVGVTGGIGSGKSTVCSILAVLGAPVFHADDESKELLDHDPHVKEAVIAAFGTELYISGKLDRKALAAHVFSDPTALATLNAIVHPAVRERTANWVRSRTFTYVVIEAAILVETGGHDTMDHLVVVSAPRALCIQRVMQRDGVSKEAVEARMNAQTSDDERRRFADTVIVNDEQQLVIPQVLALHNKLMGE